MPPKLSPAATIATAWPSLSNQRDYIANVRHKMLTCKNKHGSAMVKIGVTGTGQKPCYRIWYYDSLGQEAVYGSYWDMHDPLVNEYAINNNWSTTSMDFEAVDQLMRAKFPPKKA